MFRWLLMIWLLSLLPAAVAHSATETAGEHVVRIAVPYDLPPLAYLSAETGEPTGLHVALWRRWAAMTGTEIRLLPLDRSEALAALRSGKVDLISSMASLEAPDLQLSEPLSRHAATLIGRPDTPQGGRFGVIGYEHTPGLHEAGAQLIPYSGLGAMLRAFREGELDGIYTSVPALARELCGHILGINALRELSREGGPLDYYAVSRHDNRDLIGSVNEGMRQIKREGEWATLFDRRFETDPRLLEHYEPNLVNLTLAERRYLAERGPVRVGYDRVGLPPYHQVVGETPVGASVNLLKEIGRRTGLRFTPVLVDKWTDALEALKARRVELLAATVETPVRSGYAVFSRPYEEPSWMVIRRTADRKPLAGPVELHSLAGQTLALPAGFAIAELLLGQVPEVSVMTVADTAAALRAVVDGRADAAVEWLPTVRSVLAASAASDLSVAPLKGMNGDLHLAVRADQPLLLSILNKALATLSYRDIIHSKQPESIAPLSQFQLVEPPLPKWALLYAAVVLSGFLILLMLLLWNRRLLHEVRRHKRIEKKLNRARQRAWDAANAKARFLAVMSHEIRTPLNGILGMMELLGQGTLEPAQRQKLAVAQESSRSLLTIINDILEFSRLEAGKLQLDRQSVSIDAVVAPVFSTMAVSAQRKELAFITEIAPELQQACYWLDPTRLRQVLFNLIGNAIKFTAEGKVQVTLRCCRELQSEFLLLEVLDTGIGIPKEKLASLFEAFEQAEASTSRVYGGSGLGLTIGRSLVELMEGTLALESTVGLGTRVSVTLPLKSACGVCLKGTCSFDTTTVSDKHNSGLSFAEPLSLHTGHRLLLVEDHPVNRMVLLEQLRQFGIEVDVATNGREALSLYQQQSYSLVLADCQMPVMDGFELAGILRHLQQLQERRIPVIAITAHASEGIEATCRAAGFTDVLGKPISLIQLEQLLNRYLASDKIPVAEPAAHGPPLLPVSPSEPASAPSQSQPQVRPGLPPQLLDISVIVDSFGSEAPMQPLFAAYLDSHQEDMNRLQAAADRADILAIRQAAHRLKGAARMIGASAFAECCAEVEAACYLGLNDMNALAPQLEVLSRQHAMLLLHIESLELAT